MVVFYSLYLQPEKNTFSLKVHTISGNLHVLAISEMQDKQNLIQA